MNKPQYILLVVICLSFVTLVNAQHRRYVIKNGIAIGGGLIQFDISTENLTPKKETDGLLVPQRLATFRTNGIM